MFMSVYHVTVPRKPSCEAFFCAVPNCIVVALHNRGLSTPLAFVSSKSEARRKKFLNFEIQTLCNHFETTSHRVHCKQPAIFSYFSNILNFFWLFEVACGFHTPLLVAEKKYLNLSLKISNTFQSF